VALGFRSVFTYPTVPWSPEARGVATARLRAIAARLREDAIEAADAIRYVKASGAHWRAGAASIREFAERNGMSSLEARTYENVARAFEMFPECRVLLRRGETTVAAVAVLGEVSQLPEAGRRPDDRWVEWAKTEDARTLRRRFERRRDELRAGQPVVPLTANVTPQGREDVERARVLLSRPAHFVFTIGQTIEAVFRDWLASNDPLRRTPGPRRTPDTATRPDDRYVPAEVDREVRRRDDDRCAVPFCAQPFWVERAHRVPHRDGSGRETKDLSVLCDFHNFLHEMGDLRLEGTADRPIFLDRDGVPLGRRAVWSLGWPGDPAASEAPSKSEGDPAPSDGAQHAPCDGPDESRARAPP
jgi:hypothetical protein